MKLLKILESLRESPDMVDSREFGMYEWDGEYSTITFGYYKKYMMTTYSCSGSMSKTSSTHDEIGSFYSDLITSHNFPSDIRLNKISLRKVCRKNMINPGRIFIDPSIITFWDYPSSQQELIKIIKDIRNELLIIGEFVAEYKEIGSNLNVKYIEIVYKRGTEYMLFDYEEFGPWDMKSKIISINDYNKYIKKSKEWQDSLGF